MHSWFVHLQQQNCRFGSVKMILSAMRDENQTLNVLDLEEKKRAIDERIVSYETLRYCSIANGIDVDEKDFAACQELR